MDVFENNIYWTTRRPGELVAQDKFGRGVPQTLVKRIILSAGVKVYHQLRYNLSLHDPCFSAVCSHLCVSVPGGHKCLCPDNVNVNSHTTEIVCDASIEREKPAPRVCACQNGGFCNDGLVGQESSCACLKDFHGEFCEINNFGQKSSSSTSTVVVAVVVCILILLGAAAVVMVLKKRPL